MKAGASEHPQLLAQRSACWPSKSLSSWRTPWFASN